MSSDEPSGTHIGPISLTFLITNKKSRVITWQGRKTLRDQLAPVVLPGCKYVDMQIIQLTQVL